MTTPIGPRAGGVIACAEARAAQRGAATARIVILTITGFLIASLWLATATTVPELVRAHGALVPIGHAQQVQAPEQGVVAGVLVEEGERVTENQLLTILTSPDLEQVWQDVIQEKATLETRLENLRVIVRTARADAQIDVPAADTEARVDLSYAAARLALFAAQQEVQVQLRQHLETTLATLKNARDLTAERVAARIERVERAERLFAHQLTPRRDLDHQRDGLDQLQASLIEIDVRLSQAEKELGNAGSALMQNLIALLEEANTEIFDLEKRIDRLALQQSVLETRREALRIRAPGDGIIHAVGFPNPGEVIATGTTLFELMPAGPLLMAELQIDPVDIGHIRPGDAVSLKFDTFDARRFGQIEGRIASISPNSVIDEQTGDGYFRAAVSLDQASVGQGVWQRPLQAGMGTSAEIVTDERTVLAYLVKPISRSFDNAFGER